VVAQTFSLIALVVIPVAQVDKTSAGGRGEHGLGG